MRAKNIFLGALIGLSSAVLQGCFYIPPIPFNVTLANNAALPAILGTIAGADIDGTASLPDVCTVPTEAQLREMVGQYVPAFLLNMFQIQSITLNNLNFVANEGDFNDLNLVGLALVVDSVPIPIGQASSAEGLGTSFQIEPIPPVDLFHVLLDREPGSCIVPRISVEGKVPSQSLRFTITAEMTFTVSFI